MVHDDAAAAGVQYGDAEMVVADGGEVVVLAEGCEEGAGSVGVVLVLDVVVAAANDVVVGVVPVDLAGVAVVVASPA